ncbi:enolase C-terminal domain-like protein [Roseovarius sp.]|uniref:enolase C-terminal domain-like protein n=1 Tax=Roseovarius sp. TaxID=1486281 RepID=UPI003566DD3B
MIQVDLAKWGGPRGCTAVGREIIASGKNYCPHVPGGGVSLLASAQTLAAVGGPGVLEVDANPNPLRSLLMDDALIMEGALKVPDRARLGVSESALERIEEYRTA